MPSDKTLDVRPGSIDSTSMRYHELWLQRWLYSRFFVREGYPIPVVFSTPMDAFSHFNKLWADEQNPFAYLLNVKDDQGTPLYEPHPSPVRYPLISVMRKGLKFRPYQNFSIHRWQHINWPTVSDAEPPITGKPQIGTDLTKCNLAHVTTSRMPMAFDFKFQIDHFCLRPDTQAFYVEKLINQFWRSGGGMQSWMDIEYPGWGQQYIRLYIDGDIDQAVPEEYQDKNVEFRTSFTLTIEGFSIDVNYEVKPAVWKIIPWSGTPDELNDLLRVKLEVDLRQKGFNQVLESRPNIPSSGTCQSDLLYASINQPGIAYFGDQAGTNAGDNVKDSNHDPVLLPTDPIIASASPPASGSEAPYPGPPSLFYGIPSTLVFGYGTLVPLANAWISGHVTPAVAGIGIEFPLVGTYLTDATGSYAGTVPAFYDGTAVPHYAQAREFSPPIRVYADVPVAANITDQDYTWFTLFVDPWIAGDVTPPAPGIGVEFPAVGTFAADPSTGSYTGTVPYGYSGTAVPHYFDADTFTPPVRVYENQTSDIAAQDYHWSPIIHNAGTDALSSTTDFGNIPIYNLENIINSPTWSLTAFGTHAFVVVPGAAGTDTGAELSFEAFGSHTPVSVLADSGTDAGGTLSFSAFGTHLQVAFAAECGTNSGTLGFTTFGTAELVGVHAGTYADATTSLSFEVFGTYVAS